MQESPTSLTQLFARYVENTYSVADLRRLQAHFGTESNQETLSPLVLAALEQARAETTAESAQIDRIAANIDARIAQRFQTPHRPDIRPQSRRLPKWYGVVAAAVIFALAVAFFFWDNGTRNKDQRLAVTEILPGGNRATITLADGTTVDLSSEHEGIIIQDGITYPDGSEVVENGKWKVENEGPGEENAITTPKGGTYQVTLPDGSKVWLNAASTLRYPSRFSGDSREVFLEGEAYFDVASIYTRITDAREQIDAEGPRASVTRAPSVEKRVPFKVQTSGQTVEVLGTEFNISAYPDEDATKTTLVEGKVRVGLSPAGGGRGRFLDLKPGNQSITRARLPGQGAAISVQEVDTQPYTAWKDGNFVFSGADIQTVMTQLARWYDIDVVYEGPQVEGVFYADISRNRNISDILSTLEKTNGVRFNVKGRRIMVSR